MYINLGHNNLFLVLYGPSTPSSYKSCIKNYVFFLWPIINEVYSHDFSQLKILRIRYKERI